MIIYTDYIKRHKRVGKFGISYLDKKFKGIHMGDLILLGARSGAGKSTISKIIALHNQGQKVALFSLENFDGDDLMKECYFEYIKRSRDYNLHILDFMDGDPNIIDYKIQAQAQEYVDKKFKHIHLISRQDGYNIENLKDDLIDAVENRGIKLIILDHLDYLDKIDERSSDVMHISEIMKIIRQLQNKHDCAIIAISHLRKSQGKEPPVVPSMDEFIGSSNKVKEATAVIVFAPDDDYNIENPRSSIKATWCCIRKSRFIGIDNTVARLSYNIRTDRYSEDYNLFTVNYSGSKTEAIENDN